MVQIKKCVMVDTDPSIKEVISYITENNGTMIYDTEDKYIFITEQGARNIEGRVKEMMKGMSQKLDNF